MVYTEEYLKEKLTKELDAVHVEVKDESDGCGAKFSVVIVSDKFQGKPLLARHSDDVVQGGGNTLRLECDWLSRNALPEHTYCQVFGERFFNLLARLVNSILQEELKTIHAFTQKTLTADQWKSQ